MRTFGAVARLAEEMAGQSSRLKKRAAVADALQKVHQGDTVEGDDLRLFCLYLAGLPFSAADTRKLNAGGALLTKAVFAASGATEAEFTAAYRRHGDLGAAAYDLLLGKAGVQEKLTLGEVRDAFAGMATARTTAVRTALVDDLLNRATALDAKYLLKLMLGDMRTGVKESLVEEAIAVAAGADLAMVRHAVMLEADLGAAAERAFAGTLAEARMRLFHPLGVMLASPVETPAEAVERFTPKPEKSKAPKPEPKTQSRKKGPKAAPDSTMNTDLDPTMREVLEADVAATMLSDAEPLAGPAPLAEDAAPSSQVEALLEDKFDGMRAQIHCGDPAQPGRVAIYSRTRDDVTESFPELVEAFSQVRGEGDGLILDGEILGWDFNLSQALPFAVLGQRIGRKRVSNDVRQAIPVVFMAFDLMFAGGELQLALPLRERRNRLESVVERCTPLVRSPLVLELAARRSELQASIFDGQEEAARREDGVPRLMLSPARLVQSADEIDRAYHEARARANEGVMLKAAGSPYLPGRRGIWWVKLKRELATLDVVVTGCEFGSGRKSQFLSDYTFAVQDAQGDLLNVGKAYSGVTDAEIAELTEFFKAHTLEDRGHFRTVEPLVVFEVAFNNIMRSDRHASGFALRFPRILRIRQDKPLAEIDTVARVEEIYQSQVDKPVEAEDAPTFAE